MSKEKQIEEMAKVIDEFTEPLSARDIHKAEFSEQFAEHLYNADYRKQSENVIELPCAVGTKIYELCFEKEDPCSWCKHDHSGFGDYICDLDYDHYPQVKDFINGEKICPEFQMTIIDRTFDLGFYHYDKDWFNITWFLTKEEAEEALAKMKGGAE